MKFGGIYEANENDILFESFDDEIVIINLKSGVYYSLDKTGKLFWELLLNKVKPSVILKVFQNSSILTGENLEKVEDFLNKLNSEGLIRPLDDEAHVNSDTETAERLLVKLQNITEVPVIEKYTDQQELLLLDPIHEVSDLGWPDKVNDDPDNG